MHVLRRQRQRRSPTDESLNNGEDITRPLNRFDVRMQVKTLPDSVESDRNGQ
jgi:hypothetical protein